MVPSLNVPPVVPLRLSFFTTLHVVHQKSGTFIQIGGFAKKKKENRGLDTPEAVHTVPAVILKCTS